MRIITRAVLDWDGNILEEDSFEYCGPVAECKSSGSPPQPVDPYQQAAAQYELGTGTAAYNAALNRTNSSNPLGSNTWNVDGYSTAGTGTGGAPSSGGYGPYSLPPGLGGGMYGFGGNAFGSSTLPNGMPNGSGAPIYSQNTSLTPWANKLLASPIDTSQIPGMPGGPNLEQNVGSAENATFAQEMNLLQPQEQLQTEQNQAQLANEGAMPGSAAYGFGTDQLAREQAAENTQAANQAVTTGMGELPMLYGLGSTSLQNQLAERSAPISEYESLAGNPTAGVSAATPDISGAFGQQYQGALAGYNANTASNNATTGAVGGLASAGLMAYLMSLGSAF